MLSRFFDLITRLLVYVGIKKVAFTSHYIVSRYVLAGCHFAEMVSQINVKGYRAVEASLAEWETAEQEYIARGYRTLPVSAFMDHTMWQVPLKDVAVQRSKGEPAMHHATFYRLYSAQNNGVTKLESLFSDDGLDWEPTRRRAKYQG